MLIKMFMRNKLYLFSVLTLIALICTLNLTKSLYQCALIGTLITLNMNLIIERFGVKFALQGLCVGFIIGLSLFWNYEYRIYGKIIPNLIIASFLSLLMSSLASSYSFIQLRRVMRFNSSQCTSAIICSIIDCVCMGCFYLGKYNLYKVMSMTVSELLFKALYIGTIYIAVKLVLFSANVAEIDAH